MKKDSITQHYKSVSISYDELWNSPGQQQVNKLITRDIIKTLALEPNNILVDLGCGTGIYAKAILHQMELKHRIICVDPSPNMLACITEKEVFETICSDALKFCSGDYHYDKIFMKGTLHHIPEADWAELFSNLYNQLAPQGRLLLIITSPNFRPPVFKDALQYMRQLVAFDSQPLLKTLTAIGFKVSESEMNYPITIEREHAFKMMRYRATSYLSLFDDRAIEQGIEEMKRQYPEPTISFLDQYLFVSAIKSAEGAA